VKKGLVDGGAVGSVVTLLRKHPNSIPVITSCCKALNALFEEADGNIRKEIATVILEAGGFVDLMGVVKLFNTSEDVIEQAIPVLDFCLEFSAKCEVIETDNLDLILSLMQKHRFPVQVHCASILSRAFEEERFGTYISTSGAIPVLVKLMGTESFLRAYESKSREVCIKALNKCAAYPESIEILKKTEVAKSLQLAMSGYTSRFIIQIQGILLIKALAKDPDLRQQLAQNGVSQLLTTAAKQHTVTRLQKIVTELKETYFW